MGLEARQGGECFFDFSVYFDLLKIRFMHFYVILLGEKLEEKVLSPEQSTIIILRYKYCKLTMMEVQLIQIKRVYQKLFLLKMKNLKLKNLTSLFKNDFACNLDKRSDSFNTDEKCSIC